MKYSKLIILTLIVLSVTGCSLVNTLRIRNENDDIRPIWKNGQVKAELATHYIGVKPYVEISINGVDGFKFLIDTGASFSILMDTDKVKRLGLKPGYELELHGWGDEQHSPAHQTFADKVELADVSFTEVTFAYLPLSTSRYYLKREELIFDGVLGHDILHHFSWTFDKQANQISISKQPYQLIGEEVEIPFDISFSKLGIVGEIDFGDGQLVTQEVVIDTGSRHYLKVNAAFINNENIKLPKTKITAADFGLSGQTVHQRFTLPNLKFSSMNFKNVKTNVIGSIDDDEDEFWVIGSALLNQSISVIDYHSNKMYLLPYQNKVFRSQYNLIGLELRKLQTGDFIVRYIFPQLVASKYDIKKGDEITKIDGQPAKDVSLEQWLAISNRAGNHEICRTRLVEQCFAILSNEIEGYSVK